MIYAISAFTEDLIPFVASTKPFLQYYCTKHDIILQHHIIAKDYQKPFSWYKIDLIQQIFQTIHDGDIVWWLDADTLIINPDIVLAEYLNPDKLLHFTQDWNGINCGVFFIQKNTYTINLLEHIATMDNFLNHIWWEQAAIQSLVQDNYNDICSYIHYLPQKIFNAYECEWYNNQCQDCQVDNNSLILHMPALPVHIRKHLVNKYARQY